MILRTLERFAANNAWSNLRLLRACGELGEGELGAPRTSFFPSLVETLNHILIVDWYYVDALTKGGRGRALFADPVPFREHAPLMEAQLASDRKLVAFVKGLREEDLGGIVEIPRKDFVQRETVLDTLLHMFTHQTHHRGQVHAMLAGTAVKPPPLDEYFMEMDRPVRAAELRDLGLE